jgi:hypothetical protein
VVVVVVACPQLAKPVALVVVQVAIQQLQVVHRLPRVVDMVLQVEQVPTHRVFMLLVLVVVVQAGLVLQLCSIRNQALTVVRVRPALSRVPACFMQVVVVVVLTVHLIGQMVRLAWAWQVVEMAVRAQTGQLLV